MKYLYLTATIYILNSCMYSSDDEKHMEYALRFSKQNIKEIEQVLCHYKNDSVKLEAAQFLIKNMPYYYSYEGWQLDTLKNIEAKLPFTKEVSKKDRMKWGTFSPISLNKKYDSHVITADYLIKNIDQAFYVWENRPWSKYYSFEDFCEYILPYRIGNEPLEEWRQIYYERYAPILDSLYSGSDVVEAANCIAKQLLKEGFYNNDKEELNLPHLGASFFLQNRVGGCRESCDFTVYVMRALGIPTSIDRLYYSPNLRSVHFWNVIKDTTKAVVPFWFAESGVQRGADDKRKKRKVYRTCFGLQSEIINNVSREKNILSLFRNRFLKDVTSDYFGKNELHITLKNPIQNSWIYLGGFTPIGWIPMGITIVKNKKEITFYNVEPNLIYQLQTQIDANIYPINRPFFFDGESIKYFTADTSNWITATLTRKCAVSTRVHKHLENIVGGKLEGSVNSDFKDAELLYKITDIPQTIYNKVFFKNPKKYRYIRYTAEYNKTAEIAEISIYSDLEQTKKIPYTSLNFDRKSFTLLHNEFNMINDGEPLSYIESKQKGDFITLDLGKKVPVDNLIYTSRNDDNFIRIGDVYELIYQNSNAEWISLGRQTAEKDTLYYKIPQGALLWLKNITRGNEEELFEYKDGKQIFL